MVLIPKRCSRVEGISLSIFITMSKTLKAMAKNHGKSGKSPEQVNPIMKKRSKFILSGVLIASLISVSSFIYYDREHITTLSRLRRTDDPIMVPQGEKTPSLDGLKELHASGSRRPNRPGLLNAFENINMPVYIFDLQQEEHYFIKGIPERSFGYDRSEKIGEDMNTAGIRHYLRRLLWTRK